MNSDFQKKIKFHVKSTLETLEIEGIRDILKLDGNSSNMK